MVRQAKRNPAHRSLARELGVAILTGRYLPGAVLPGELEFAESRNVSRSVVREALRTLAAKGLIDSRPKAGTRVRARADWNLLDPDLLAWMFEGEPPMGFVDSLFQLRMIVEPAAAEMAARLRTTRHIARLGHALEVMEEEGLSSAEGQAADQQFHNIILEATANDLLISLSGSIGAAVRSTTLFKHRKAKQLRDSIPLHRDLFSAITDGDPVAARAATITLILQAQEDIETSLQG
ncbi:FadR/GntR family transcriptional regulator [Sphingomonas sp. HT-1]|uniref:FadR/GntR family transcriptional regulator n=1 Tax=unclassified Sphingomonas TaxID=196159 RepID=UPI00036F59A3|nr:MULTISPECIES: FadR/GntR family transcriptional regulator [unclassified Sphingomonas]KTF69034.1 GntR family transcriptional regulator [Sphingomonas sp. WG]